MDVIAVKLSSIAPLVTLHIKRFVIIAILAKIIIADATGTMNSALETVGLYMKCHIAVTKN